MKLALAKFVCSLFFSKALFVGRFFEESSVGYLWCLRSIWTRNILRLAPPAPLPTHYSIRISNFSNLEISPSEFNNLQSPGCYYQNRNNKIVIGAGVYISQNVGFITENHDKENLDQHVAGKDILIGDGCWIGMNAIIMPGVILPRMTIVGAGAVVTKSPRLPGMTLVGVPAKPIGNQK